MKSFEIGTKVFCYYDDVMPCVEGTIISDIKDVGTENNFCYCQKVNWDYGGRSFFPEECIFMTKEECLHYNHELKVKEEANRDKLFEVCYLDDCEFDTYLAIGKSENEIRFRESKKLKNDCSCFMQIASINEVKEVDGHKIIVE